LLDGRRQFERAISRLRADHRERTRRAGERIAAIVRAYVSVNLLLAGLAGVFTWLALELIGVELAVPLAVLVAIFDLVPLVGLTIGGLFVAVVAALHDFPTALIIWAALFLVYQQLQDRVIQPIFYRSAVRIHPVVAIVVVLAGAQLAGILGALLAIPVAASLGAIYDELWPSLAGADPDGDGGSDPEPAPAG
jgi:predicted PurR-regulated permease PerM